MAIIFGIILGILSVSVIFFRPIIGLVLYTIIIYIRPADFFPILSLLHLARVLAIVTLLSLIFAQIGQRKYLWHKNRQLLLLSILIFVALISVFTSIWKSNSLEAFIDFLKIYIIFILIINLIDNVKKLKFLIWTMIISGLTLSILGIKNWLLGVNVFDGVRMGGIGKGMFTDPNYFALGLIVLLPFVYFLLFEQGGIKRILLFSTFIIFLAGIALTYSRGGFFGLSVVLFLLFLYSPVRIKIVYLLIVLCLFFSFALPKQYLERAHTSLTEYKSDPSIVSRIDAWKAGMNMMIHRPLGVGIGNFGEGFVKYRLLGSLDLAGLRRAAHNSFIQIGAELGIAGLVIYAALFFTSFTALRIKKKTNIFRNKISKELRSIYLLSLATKVSLIGFMISGFFLSLAYCWSVYYLFAFVVVLNKLMKNYDNVQTV